MADVMDLTGGRVSKIESNLEALDKHKEENESQFEEIRSQMRDV